jgi:hypothetical protein
MFPLSAGCSLYVCVLPILERKKIFILIFNANKIKQIIVFNFFLFKIAYSRTTSYLREDWKTNLAKKA